jgi:hypothetical protein
MRALSDPGGTGPLPLTPRQLFNRIAALVPRPSNARPRHLGACWRERPLTGIIRDVRDRRLVAASGHTSTAQRASGCSRSACRRRSSAPRGIPSRNLHAPATLRIARDGGASPRCEGKQYLSLKNQMEHDCKSARGRLLSSTAYSGHMGKGSVVISDTSFSPAWQPVQAGSGSPAEALAKIACTGK